MNKIYFTGLSGITQTRSVREILIGYKDPILGRISTMNPAQGGNPSVNPIVALCPNFSYPVAPGSEDFRSMYTGEGDVNKVRYYKRILGHENITFNNTDFNGNESYSELIDAWKEPVQIVGTDAFLNQPLEKEDTVVKVKCLLCVMFDFIKKNDKFLLEQNGRRAFKLKYFENL
jgi:hypothetical protein